MKSPKAKVENLGLSPGTRGFGAALALASVVNGLLVVAKETSPRIQAGMKQITGHHWITHSTLIVALFLLAGWYWSRANGGTGIRLTPRQLLVTLIAGVSLGGLIILGFYLRGD